MTKEARAQVLAEVPATLRAASAEIARLRAENQQYREKLAQAELAGEVVDLMEQRGLGERGIPRKEKIAMLLQSGKDLEVTKKALELQAPDMSFAKVASAGGAQGADSEDQLTAFIMTGR